MTGNIGMDMGTGPSCTAGGCQQRSKWEFGDEENRETNEVLERLILVHHQVRSKIYPTFPLGLEKDSKIHGTMNIFSTLPIT